VLVLSDPVPARNPGGFDEKSYYNQQGIFLKGRMVSYEVIQHPNIPSPTIVAARMRNGLIHSMNRMLPRDNAGLLAALILGDKTGLDAQHKKWLVDAGVSHIAAVSGSAVSFLFFPFKRLLRRLRLSRKKRVAFLFVFLVAFGYLTSWTPSVSRALIMMMIVLASQLVHRRISYAQIIARTVAVLVSVDPVLALNLGFWYSILATSGLILFGEHLSDVLEKTTGIPGVLSASAGITIAAGVSVLPLQILTNNEVSAISVLSNLLIMPAVSILVPCGLIASWIMQPFQEGRWMQWMALPLRGLTDWIFMVSEKAASAELFRFRIGRFPGLVFVAAVFFLLYIAVERRTWKRTALYLSTGILLAAMLANGIARIRQPEVLVVFADVGQGDCTFILLRNKTSILIDAGDERNGLGAIEGILDYYGVSSPDVHIVTHTHADHCGGMIPLIATRGGKTLIVPKGAFSPEFMVVEGDDAVFEAGGDDGGYRSDNLADPLRQAALAKGMKIVEATSHNRLDLGDGTILDFHNPPPDVIPGPDRLNDHSLVMSVTHDDFRVLIAGDATGEAETMMLEGNEISGANIYRIAHHGSKSSTNHDIISAVHPEISIISVGFNFYGHPSESVLRRLDEMSEQVLRTDRNGAILVRYGKGRYSVQCMLP
jgi:competence protein ComEC